MCWDSAPPSRLRQRSGRTGRHRPGKVVHLLLEGRELDTYHSHKDKEARVAVSCVSRWCGFWSSAQILTDDPSTRVARFVPRSFTLFGCYASCCSYSPSPSHTLCAVLSLSTHTHHTQTQDHLRNASTHFELCHRAVRMLPEGVSPVPTLLPFTGTAAAAAKVCVRGCLCCCVVGGVRARGLMVKTKLSTAYLLLSASPPASA